MLSENKRTIFVSAFNCESRLISLISDTIDSNAAFIILDPFKRLQNVENENDVLEPKLSFNDAFKQQNDIDEVA